MMTWINAIILGAKLFTIFTSLLTIPFEASKASLTKRFNPIRFVVNQICIFYMACLLAVVFFPLPTASQAIGLVYRIQKIPFYAIYDVVTNFSVEAVLQILFNIMMTVPFGIMMGYRFGFSTKKTILASLCLSLFIEVGQLTGLFFVYHGSFRLCDVDDLMLNTLGGFIGAVIYNKIAKVLPNMNKTEFAWNDGILAHV